MQFKQLVVATLVSLATATAIPNPSPDNVQVEARSADSHEIDARDTAKTAAVAKEAHYGRGRCYDDWYDYEGRCCRWHYYRREYYGCRGYWYDY
ncbi:hypothetical protein CDD80_1826 [Ophiocordyceps camponoti-rufipedis]|uniref:Uncharacterized protein n=1 Tax=Ophiocordyceps camponoti-rufipedis TaxID=2004952 RepID=A0A2C5Z7W5_9HYPO|nr:hypothetical protein CDD80_1826 [Ophiocordyceps camponoti-rufipedis]